MKPTTSSTTDGTKPGPARVTSTPALVAAGTSTLLMSTATRTNADNRGSPANTAAGPAVMRSATITRASPAAATSRAGSSGASPSCSRKLPSARRAPSAWFP